MLILPLLTVAYVVFISSTCTALFEEFWAYGGPKYDPVSHPHWSLLNDTQCGLSHSFRIIGGENAGLGTYPWMVRLAFKYRSGTIESILLGGNVALRCSGSIINSKYIITAGHCFPKGQYLAFVRVGEYNADTNPDCDEDNTCAPPYVDHNVKKVIIHPKYSVPKTFSNDIALVRVKGTIVFNDFVKPICLPYGKLMDKTYLGMQAEVAGWGIYDMNIHESHPILQVITIPIISNNDCKKSFPKNSGQEITKRQICAGGIVNKDSCGGDSGGPLMLPDTVGDDKPRYFLTGIVSFGLTDCGVKPIPAVHTRVTAYMDWVLMSIEK